MGEVRITVVAVVPAEIIPIKNHQLDTSSIRLRYPTNTPQLTLFLHIQCLVSTHLGIVAGDKSNTNDKRTRASN